MTTTEIPAAGGPSGLHAANRRALRDLVNPARLREFFAPQSIAMVGASDNSGWARFIVTGADLMGFTGPLIPVHPKAQTAFGKPVVPNLRALDGPVDMAFILAPIQSVESVLDDMGAAGIRNGVVLAAGYREVGEEGRALEDAMVAKALEHGIVLLGPNCLGFLNAQSKSPVFALGIPPPLTAGPVGIALQSGALATAVLSVARAQGIGVSTLTTMGNECMISTIDMVDYLAEDEDTKVICLFLEEISDPVKFAAAAEKADRAGKPIVAVKVGSSPIGQAAALAHTGSVAGDDAVVDAVLKQLNVIRVNGIEELLSTGALLAYNRWPAGRRVGIVTASGGACDIICDAGSAQGLEVPDFAPETVAAIEPLLPPFATAHNPLDVTGYGLANAPTGMLTSMDYALEAAIADPGLDFILFGGIYLPDAAPPEPMATMMAGRLDWITEKMASARIPVIPLGMAGVDLSAYSRDVLTPRGIYMVPGLNHGVGALGNALRWLERRGQVRAVQAAAPATRAVTTSGPWSEAQARDLLSSAGVPVVPGELANSADEAAAAAARLGLPVVLKICSAQITHKSDIGGVALGLDSEAAVRAAYDRVRAAGDGVTGAEIEGVLVLPMRSGGVELLAGVTVDPTFGPVLAVGLGGVWVEILQDTSLRPLPVDAAEVRRMLGDLRGLPLLQGARGTAPADLDAVAAAIAAIGDTALSLGGALGALEVNPLWVNGDQVEALDVLVVTEPENS
ncbi:MAG TPA: acetate--CoA ligase family protein [Streptosporangiaceae bacterium]